MAQLLNAADNAGTSLFDTVAKTVGTIDKTVTVADDALDVLLTRTSDWKERAILDSNLNRMERTERYVNSKAMDLAKDQLRMQEELKANPELRKLFENIKKRHAEMLAAK